MTFVTKIYLSNIHFGNITVNNKRGSRMATHGTRTHSRGLGVHVNEGETYLMT